jgi:phosphoribosylglycinamide formyltransferase-1
MRLLLFASGRGSNFQAILNAVNKGYISAKIVGLIVDRNCKAAEIANDNKIKVSKISPMDFNVRLDYESELAELVKSYKPDLVILAGYMKLIPSSLVDMLPLKIINIHPSLLPSFRGMNGIRQAWKARVKLTGVTVHYINDKLDEGIILAQAAVPMADSVEQLEENIHKTEHELYVDVIKDLAENYYDTVLVSACLTGENCRYDGGNKYSGRVNTFLSMFSGDVIKICPELEAGFPVPRPRIDILNGKAVSEEGVDVTDRLLKASEKISELLKKSKRALVILREKSPSCGYNVVDGIFANYLRSNLSSKVTLVTDEEI